MSIETELKKLGKTQKTINKQELSDLTMNILNNIKIIPYVEFDPSRLSGYYRIIERDKSAICFEREAAESFECAAQLIQNDPMYAAIISEGTIYNEYEKFVLETLSTECPISDEHISPMINELLRKLRTSIGKYTVAMPVEHLALLDLPEVVLGNVHLTPFSTLKAEYENLSDFIRTGDETKIWANVVIEAQSEGGKAIQRGEYEIQRIINLLRIYIPILFHEGHHIKIGISEYKMKTRTNLRIDDHGKIGLTNNNLGPFGNYNLNMKKLEMLKEDYCLNEISEILSKDPSLRSKLEKSIIMAVRWLGLGVDEDTISEQFIKYAIALECLLLEGEGKKADHLAKNAAFILGETTVECFEIENKVKALYGIRSTIVHQGVEEENEEVIKKLAKDLYVYTMKILLELSKKTTGADKWDSIESLVKEMNTKTYSR